MTDMTTTTGGHAATMSSREIAELTNKEHRNVKRDIENMVRELGLDALSFEHIYIDTMNRQQTEYLLNRELTETLITGYSVPLRNRVIRRLHELEVQASAGSFQMPRTRAEALRLAADLEEQNAALQLENQHQAETIASLESLFMAGETPTQFCKRLNGVNCARVNSTLLELGWLYDEQRDEQGSPRYRVASRVRDKYLTERPRKIAPEGSESFIKYDLQLLLAGAQRLHQLYMQQKLAMKATWDGRFTQAKYAGETIA